MTSNLLDAPQEFLRLFMAGKNAARAGEKKKAHDLFRRAIEIDPYREQVWLWLASVVETDEDRRVCFENVLELNPTNPTARRQLQKLDQRTPGHAPSTSPKQHGLAAEQRPTRQAKQRVRGKRSLRLILLALIVATSVLAVVVVTMY